MENQEENTQQPAAPSQPELTISDLTNLRSIVETAVRRGAFQASELSAVGSVYDRVNTFLNAVSRPAQPQQEQQEPEQQPTA